MVRPFHYGSGRVSVPVDTEVVQLLVPRHRIRGSSYLYGHVVMGVRTFQNVPRISLVLCAMRRYTTLIATIVMTGLSAQWGTDSLAFMKARRMSDADLLKKREGTFFTGIPDLSSDPVTGFGLGIRGNVYWNGARSDQRFAYTPYLAKLKANAAYYTSNTRELVLSLDVPYYKGTRWRFKIDLKAQQNPANLYFGLTEATLGPLRLPSDPDGTGTIPMQRMMRCGAHFAREVRVRQRG